MEQMQQIDLRSLVVELDALAGEADSKLFDEGKGNPSHPLTLITLMIRQMRFILLTALYINSGEEGEKSDWLPEMSLSLPILNRNLVELLCNLVFILEEPGTRVPWFQKSGWRDAAMNVQRLQAEFGTSSELKAGLDGLAKWVSTYGDELGISSDERQNPKQIQEWIGIGNIADYRIGKNDPRPAQRNLIHFLHQWYFPQYSWTTHGQWYGFLRNGTILLRNRFEPGQGQRQVIDNVHIPFLRSIEQERGVLFFLAAVTEIDLYFKFGLAPKLFSLWDNIRAVPIASAFEAATIYEKGFKSRKAV